LELGLAFFPRVSPKSAPNPELDKPTPGDPSVMYNPGVGTWLVMDGEVLPYERIFAELHPGLGNLIVAPWIPDLLMCGQNCSNCLLAGPQLDLIPGGSRKI